ncbi:ferrochelatase [Ferrimicrobium acidiphilum]|uniref:ferrochelatase n=1 Tax=Ferrimicrobium acidiphilum TaxID=121039 RepID=UPI0023EFC429|nr:ferrochelatase [Ferrimicrobium acidiphilum]
MARPERGILWQSFGSPEGPDDVWPFLQNVTRGRGVPEARLRLVADQYLATGGSSPLNALNRDLIRRLGDSLGERGVELPIYFGNRNWHPYLADTVDEMARDGIQEALVIPSSAYSSYSGCRQYREDLIGCQVTFDTQTLKPFSQHPLFMAAEASIVASYLATRPPIDASTTAIFATAHSIPTATADSCDYQRQLGSVCEVLRALLPSDAPIELAYQSRSGDPRTPWLTPDIADAIHASFEANPNLRRVIVIPIGFISDHQEVLYDLDILARNAAQSHGLGFDRLPTVGGTSEFIEMLTELVLVWNSGGDPNSEIPGAEHLCHDGCCLSGAPPIPTSR